jgi:biopolymer transport protein ExbB
MKRSTSLPRRRKFMAVLAVAVALPAVAFAQTPSAAPTLDRPPVTTPSPAPAPAALQPATPTAETPTAPTATSAPTVPAASALAPETTFKLPRDLSAWGMFMAADIVVKAVMLGLAFASLLTWTIWFAKALELAVARRRLRKAIAAMAGARSLSEVFARLEGRGSDALALAQAAEAELRLSADAMVSDGIKERVASRLERVEAAAGRRMIRGTGWLATVGATAPFVGLFGTVWGIMNSFIGISKQHTTNLAVVAPGIAEALLATALGLVAAIPAVVMYNMFSRWVGGYRALLADAAAEVLRAVSRDLDRGSFDFHAAERRRLAAAAE